MLVARAGVWWSVFFEIANRAYDLLISREPRGQRPLLEVLLSNSVLAEGRVRVTFASPFDVLANPPSEAKTENGDPGSPDRRHSVWSGWANAYRTAALDLEVCSVERSLAFKVAMEPA